MSKRDEKTNASAGRFAYQGLDKVIHEKSRLCIMTSLVTHPRGLLFNDLKELCSLTDGNLSRHLHVLHQSGLVEVWKGVQNNRSLTLCRLTETGRRRFLDYVNALEAVVRDATPVNEPLPAKPTTGEMQELSPA